MLGTYYLWIISQKEVKQEEVLEIRKRKNTEINLPWVFYALRLDGSEGFLKDSPSLSRTELRMADLQMRNSEAEICVNYFYGCNSSKTNSE